MKKKAAKTLILFLVIPFTLWGCAGSGNPKLLNENYGGIGFEWDIFDITDSWSVANYEYIKDAAGYFCPTAIRTMLDADKFVTSFDGNGNPVYNFQTSPMKNLCDILDYCEENGITVAIGLWHARHEGNFIHDVLNDEGHPLFAEMSLKLAEYLINEKKYTCVKYVVPYNEPNYTRRNREGNALNPYALWSECMNNFIDKMPQMQFDNAVSITAPDSSSLTDSETWVKNAVEDFNSHIGLYQIHLYPSSYIVKEGGVTQRLRRIVDYTPATKEFWIYESGINDGKVDGVGQTRINRYDFALEMADLTLQTILAGCDGMIYWSIDAKMHQKDGVDLDFGLLNSQDRQKRPWFYSSALLSRCLQKGSGVYLGANEENFRMIYVKSGDDAFAIAVNRGEERETEFRFRAGEGNTLYKYIFNENDIFVSEDERVLYNEEIKGSFRGGVKTSVHSDSMVILSTKQL
jgi:hypothetical protein